MDQAIHKLNVGHYTLDVKVSQLMDRLSRMDGETVTVSHKTSNDIHISTIHTHFLTLLSSAFLSMKSVSL